MRNLARNLWPDPDDLPGLYESQRAVLPDVFRSPVSILAGTPGTGKSFVSARIISALVKKFGAHNIAVAAPTGKAAVRIAQLMRWAGIFVQATTIHRLLEVGRNGHDGSGWGFARNEHNPLQQQFIFIDEASMLDTNLAASLFRAVGDGSHVLLIGDPYQLPPVGHGAPLRDLIESGSVGYGELTVVHRNAGDIVRGCRMIKDGAFFQPNTTVLDMSSGRNWLHSEKRTASAQVSHLQHLLNKLPETFDPVLDVQVICATNGKGKDGRDGSPVSRLALNRILQAQLNPNNPITKGQPFAHADKVICVKNCLLELCEVYSIAGRQEVQYTGVRDLVSNGECGRVVMMDDKKAVIELLSPNRHVSVSLSDNPFDLGYAVTCHKMQGSQMPIIITMIDDSRGADYVTSREWHYTAVSRAEQICLTIGKWDALMRQCKCQSLKVRKTFLTEGLRDAFAAGVV